jgi:hypothetical protein
LIRYLTSLLGKKSSKRERAHQRRCHEKKKGDHTSLIEIARHFSKQQLKNVSFLATIDLMNDKVLLGFAAHLLSNPTLSVG